MFSGSGKAIFDKSLEKATSQQLLEPDWDSILAVCDSIRQGDVKAKYALDSIKKKVGHENPNVGKYALQVLESVVKNCGPPIHQEIASKESMDFLKDLARAPKIPEAIKMKILELIQVWSHAFRNDSNYKCVQDTFNQMKLEGFSFPEFKESDAMFAAELAPEWKDGDNCYTCRITFTTFTRKHHCRRCGQIFCHKCSSFNSTIPALGIEKEVRVCEQCFSKLKKLPEGAGKDDSLPASYLASPLSKQSQLPPKRSEEELREQEELALALALSQSEAEAKESEKKRLTASWASHSAAPARAEGRAEEPRPSEVIATRAPKFEIDDGVAPELARYLNRDFWEKKQQHTLVKTGASGGGIGGSSQPVTQPSAPEATHAEPRASVAGIGTADAPSADAGAAPLHNGVSGPDVVIDEEFLQVLSGSVDVFVNRMRSDSQRGRSIATDSSVQTLFEALQNMHPRLLAYMHGQEDRRAYHESLQDKLSQLKDARDALVALRDEHAERRRREAEERERQRQVQMAHKLDAMRKKKHEYLAHQRQLALQKMQEQERDLQARLEQQKQLTLMRQMQLHGFPQEFQPGFMPGYQQPVQSVGGGMYYSGPGTAMYSQQQQHPMVNDMASLQYQHAVLAGQGSMVAPPPGSVADQPSLGWQQQLPTAGQVLQQQQQPLLPQGYAAAPALHSGDAAYRMHDLATSLPPPVAMQPYSGAATGMTYSQAMGGSTAAYQQVPSTDAAAAGPQYQTMPAGAAGSTSGAGGGGGMGQLPGSTAQAPYQPPYYPAQQQQSSFPQLQQPQAFQQQMPGPFPQQSLYQQQQPLQQVQPPSAAAAYQQPQQLPPAQQYDNQLIIFD